MSVKWEDLFKLKHKTSSYKKKHFFKHKFPKKNFRKDLNLLVGDVYSIVKLIQKPFEKKIRYKKFLSKKKNFRAKKNFVKKSFIYFIEKISLKKWFKKQISLIKITLKKFSFKKITSKMFFSKKNLFKIIF